MDPVRFGRAIRALRQRRGWRQEDLAAAAGVSQSEVSRIELGDLRSIALGRVERVVGALAAEVDIRLRWSGAALDALIDAGHAQLVEQIVRILTEHGWEAVAEVSFSIYGERGSIDVFARHVASRCLLVVEVKTAIGDIQATLAVLDRKVRNAPAVARARNWAPWPVVRLLVVADTTTARRRIGEHAATFTSAMPMRSREARRWLADPGPTAAGGVWFLSPTRRAGTKSRVRVGKGDSSPTHPPGG